MTYFNVCRFYFKKLREREREFQIDDPERDFVVVDQIWWWSHDDVIALELFKNKKDKHKEDKNLKSESGCNFKICN